MKFSAISAILMLAIGYQVSVRAENKFDPAARAMATAPFIDESTVVVGCVDVSRFDVEAFFSAVKTMLPEDREAREKAELQVNVKKFLKAGGKDIFLLGRLKPQFALLAIPLASGTDEKSIRALFPPNLPSKRTEHALLIGTMLGTEIPEITPDPRPELAAAFAAAGDTTVQAVFTPPKHFKRVIEEVMPQLPKEMGGGEGSILTRGILWAALGIDLPPNLSITLVVQSQDAAAAKALRVKWLEVAKRASQWWKVKEYLPNFLKLSENLAPAAEDSRLVVSFDNREGTIDKLLEDAGIILEKEREKTRSAMSRNNLWQIGGALSKYCNANKQFPAAAIYSKEKKPLLSWRVAILPYLGLNELYKQFHLDEPWDSPHNIKLSKVPVAVYLSPNMKTNTTPDKKSFLTAYVVPVGPGTVFAGKEGLKTEDIKDGPSKTIMALEVDEDHAVVWTKPEDLPFDPQNPAKGLSNKYAFYALFCDGHITPLRSSSSADDLRAWFTAAGGEKAKNP